MKEQISKALKILFLVHFFAAIIFGLVFLIFTELHNEIFNWPYDDPISTRMLGAALIGFAASSLLSWRETEWLKVKIIVQVEIAWTAVGTATMIVSLFFFSVPIILWFYIVIFIIFLAAFCWFYYQQET